MVQLQDTRLGKHINELRRKASDKGLASRAKSLVKKWRELLIADNSGTTTPISTAGQVKDVKTVASSAVQKLTNGHHHYNSQPSSRLTSPAVSSSSRLSPGLQQNSNNRYFRFHDFFFIFYRNLSKFSRHPPSSSMPSSASSSPGLSRPTTPTNHHHTSRPVSPVSKTNVANKRLRKDEETELPPAKKAKNGITHVVSSDNHIPKNNSKVSQRKKKLEEEREHLLEQKLLTARRQASKVRTTQELVQELALNSTPTPNNKSKIIVNETKTELMNRFFQSQDPNTQENNSVLSPPLSDTVPDSPTSPDSKNEHNSHESVEDILAQLPPIDSASILAEMNSCNDEEDDIGNCQKN